MRDRQLFSGLLLILALVSLQNLCHCDDHTVDFDFSRENVSECYRRSEDFFRSEFVCFSVQVLYESFDEAFDGRWIVSKNGDYEGIVCS